MRQIVPGADFSLAGKGNVYRWYAYQAGKTFSPAYVTKMKIFYKTLIDKGLINKFDVIRLWMGSSVADILPNFANDLHPGSNGGLTDAMVSLTGTQKTGGELGITSDVIYTTVNGLHMHVYSPAMAATHPAARAFIIGVGDTNPNSAKNFAFIDKSRQGSRIAAYFGAGAATPNGSTVDVSISLTGNETGLVSAWRDSTGVVRLATAGTVKATSAAKTDAVVANFSIQEGGGLGGLYSPDKIALTAYGKSEWTATNELDFFNAVTALMA